MCLLLGVGLLVFVSSGVHELLTALSCLTNGTTLLVPIEAVGLGLGLGLVSAAQHIPPSILGDATDPGYLAWSCGGRTRHDEWLPRA